LLAVAKKHEYQIVGATILPVVLYGHETLSLTLSEEHRLRMFEDRVLREYLDPSGIKQ
jgi:hypothetical protein